MLLITCPRDGTARLQGTRSILAHRHTDRGELTIVACRCGGHAILLQGEQRAHRGPDELPRTDDGPPARLTAVTHPEPGPTEPAPSDPAAPRRTACTGVAA